MPRDLFGDLTSPLPPVNARKWYTVPISFLAHVALIVPLVLASLLAADVLPMVRDYNVFVAGAVVSPDPSPPPPVRSNPKPPVDPNAAPTEAPDRITPEPPGPFETETQLDGIPGAVPGSDVVVGAPPPPPAPSLAPKKMQPIQVGGNVSPPSKLRGAPPVYPPIAQAARVEGTVILQAVIDINGRVEDVRVLRSVPLLDQAAIEAVRRWEYTATLLNGVPVSVMMTVTVTFTLASR